MKDWKSLVRTTVTEHEQIQWQMTTLLYKKLELFTSAFPATGHICVWWVVNRRHPELGKTARTIVRLLCGEHCLGANTGRFKRGHSMCTLCTGYRVETVAHFLFECDYFAETRETLWCRILDSMPTAMKDQVVGMTSWQKTVFILSGLHSGYVPEWDTIYVAAAKFVGELYARRREAD